MVLAILNGTVRDLLYLKKLGKEWAHRVSTISLLVLIMFFSIIFNNLGYISDKNESIVIGVWWFILTLAFEFIAGHYLFKKSWHELLENYKIFKGRLWILIPIEVLIINYILFLVKK